MKLGKLSMLGMLRASQGMQRAMDPCAVADVVTRSCSSPSDTVGIDGRQLSMI